MLNVNAEIHGGLHLKRPPFWLILTKTGKVLANQSLAAQNFMKILSVAEVAACRQMAGSHEEATRAFLQCFTGNT
jgi:hypothetical protein